MLARAVLVGQRERVVSGVRALGALDAQTRHVGDTLFFNVCWQLATLVCPLNLRQEETDDIAAQ